MFDRAESSVWACGWSRNLSSIDHLVPAWFATRLNLHFFACDLSNITIIEPKFVPCRQSVFHIFKIRVPVLTVEMWFCVLSDLVERPTIYQDCQCGHTILILARLLCSVFWYFLYVPALICYLAIRLSNRLVVCGTSYLRFNWLSSGELTYPLLTVFMHTRFLHMTKTSVYWGNLWKPVKSETNIWLGFDMLMKWNELEVCIKFEFPCKQCPKYFTRKKSSAVGFLTSRPRLSAAGMKVYWKWSNVRLYRSIGQKSKLIIKANRFFFLEK